MVLTDDLGREGGEERRGKDASAQEQRGDLRGENRGAREAVQPKAAAVEFVVFGLVATSRGLEVAGFVERPNRFRGKFTRPKRVVDAFSGERLDHTGGVADQEQSATGGGDGGAAQWGNRMPGMVARQAELLLGPGAQGGQRFWFADQAEIQLIVSDRCLARVSIWEKL